HGYRERFSPGTGRNAERSGVPPARTWPAAGEWLRYGRSSRQGAAVDSRAGVRGGRGTVASPGRAPGRASGIRFTRPRSLGAHEAGAGSLSWRAFRVRPSGGARDAVIAALFEAGGPGVPELDDAVTTHCPPEVGPHAVAELVKAAEAGAESDSWAVVEADWSLAWRDGIVAQRLGHLTVAPPWLASALDPATTIVIDPGMAFGTGEHATTRGVVRLLQDAVREGDVVADLGAGSAVLAIAAAKLGARKVIAVELDEDAIPNAEENVAANGVSNRVVVVQG